MRNKLMIKELETAKEDISNAQIDSKKDFELFVKTWVIPNIDFCLKELKKCKMKKIIEKLQEIINRK